MTIQSEEKTKIRDAGSKRRRIRMRIAAGLLIFTLFLSSCGAQPSGGNASEPENTGQHEAHPDPSAAVTDGTSEDTGETVMSAYFDYEIPAPRECNAVSMWRTAARSGLRGNGSAASA